MRHLALAALLLTPFPLAAQDIDAGLEAWERIYQVNTHPRCINCHVGDDNIPLWSGPEYSEAQPHGMNINAGFSRIGAEHVACSTCHFNTGIRGTTPHAPPRAAADWRLAPVEFQWRGKSSDEMCNQLRDPDRNGNRDIAALVDHIAHDAFVLWGFNPDGGREPAPFSQAEHLRDYRLWGAVGQPCPGD